MTTPQVSILLPVWNAGATVANAIRSIQQQTFTDWELLAVDDGSTDATPRILAQLASAEPRLRVLPRPHAGLVPALNAGLGMARGEFVARMDADDESLPDRLASQVEFVRARPEIGVVGSLVEFGGDPHAAGGYALHVDWLNSVCSPAQIALSRFVESPFAHPSVLFRRDLTLRHGGYRDGDFPEDYELWLRWLEAGVLMAKVPRVLLRWNDAPGRLSRTAARYDTEAFFRCKAGFLARWLQANVPPGCRLLVWGAGRPTRRRVDWLRQAGSTVSGYVDIDPRKVGRHLDGVTVISPEQLPESRSVFILGYVAARGAREFARTLLQQRGFVEGADFLFAA